MDECWLYLKYTFHSATFGSTIQWRHELSFPFMVLFAMQDLEASGILVPSIWKVVAAQDEPLGYL
jgi:hypothetical protein